MLTGEGASIVVGAIASARLGVDGGDLVEVAAAALQRTLAAASVDAREIALLIHSGERFVGRRDAHRGAGWQSALLDNEYGGAIARELLFRRGLLTTQPHGVLFAEEAPLLAGLHAASGFVRAGEADKVLLVAVDGARAGGAVSCLIAADGRSGLRVGELRRLDREAIVAARRQERVVEADTLIERVAALVRCSESIERDGCVLVEGGAHGGWLARLARAGEEDR